MEYKSPLNPISDKDLERGYWFVTNRIFLKRLFYSIFILFNITLIVYSAYKIVNLYTTEAEEYDRMITELLETDTNYEPINTANKASDLTVGQVKILLNGQSSDDETYDLISEIYNPNKKFKIQFTYQFICNGQSLVPHNTYILPGQKKVIADFGLNLPNRNNTAQVKISDQRLERISAHKVADPISFINERLIFEIKKVKLDEIKSNKDIYKLSFDLANKSVYNYWNVGLTTLLYKGTDIIGINYITLEKFKSGAEKGIELTWYDYLPSTIKVSVIPEIDVFDDSVYMDFEGTQKGLGF